jgi:hypothetical protein
MAFLPDVDNVPIPTTQCSFPASPDLAWLVRVSRSAVLDRRVR